MSKQNAVINRNLDKYKQMHDQQQMIEERRKAISEKIQVKKRREAEEKLIKSHFENLKAELNAKGDDEVANNSANIFVNDGSFLEQFKKLSDAATTKQEKKTLVPAPPPPPPPAQVNKESEKAPAVHQPEENVVKKAAKIPALMDQPIPKPEQFSRHGSSHNKPARGAPPNQQFPGPGPPHREQFQFNNRSFSGGGSNFQGGPPPPNFQGGPSQNFQPNGPPQNFPPGGPPQNFSPGGPAQNFPPGGPPQNFPPGGPPQNFPPGGPPQNFPPGGPPQNFPSGGPPQNFPSGGPPQNFPANGPPQNFPPGGPPQNFPGGPPLQNFQGGPAPPNFQGGPLPPQNFPPQNFAPGSGPPQNFPPGGPPQNFNQNNPPQNFNQSNPPQNFNQNNPPQNFNQNNPPQNFPPGGPPQNFPQGGPPPPGFGPPPPGGPPFPPGPPGQPFPGPPQQFPPNFIPPNFMPPFPPFQPPLPPYAPPNQSQSPASLGPPPPPPSHHTSSPGMQPQNQCPGPVPPPPSVSAHVGAPAPVPAPVPPPSGGFPSTSLLPPPPPPNNFGIPPQASSNNGNDTSPPNWKSKVAREDDDAGNGELPRGATSREHSPHLDEYNITGSADWSKERKDDSELDESNSSPYQKKYDDFDHSDDAEPQFKIKEEPLYFDDIPLKNEMISSVKTEEEIKMEMEFKHDPGFMDNAIKKEEDIKTEMKTEPGSNARGTKRRSRWGDASNDVKPPGVVTQAMLVSAAANTPSISVTGMSGHMLSKVNKRDKGLLQYALSAYGSMDLSEEDWKKAEDNYKIHLLYQDMMQKRAEVERLRAKGMNKYEYDSDEDIEGGTWEHKAREKEMVATKEWASKLTEMARGKHHIGDFLPPEELKKFMDKYTAVKGGGAEPDLSDYKEFKLTEENKGFQMLQKLGWSEGQGLGADGSGIVEPVNKARNRDTNMGLGVERPDDLASGDDEYEAYRKRMMLAYRFRPNPLNNPRRPYY